MQSYEQLQRVRNFFMLFCSFACDKHAFLRRNAGIIAIICRNCGNVSLCGAEDSKEENPPILQYSLGKNKSVEKILFSFAVSEKSINFADTNKLTPISGMALQKLPIGIQDFEKIRLGDYLYVDKTEHVYNLVDRGCYYFLIRMSKFIVVGSSRYNQNSVC